MVNTFVCCVYVLCKYSVFESLHYLNIKQQVSVVIHCTVVYPPPHTCTHHTHTHTPHTHSLGQAYNESYLQLGKKRQVNFSNKLFSAWDYNITDSNTAKLKKVQIKTELEVGSVPCMCTVFKVSLSTKLLVFATGYGL